MFNFLRNCQRKTFMEFFFFFLILYKKIKFKCQIKFYLLSICVNLAEWYNYHLKKSCFCKEKIPKCVLQIGQDLPHHSDHPRSMLPKTQGYTDVGPYPSQVGEGNRSRAADSAEVLRIDSWTSNISICEVEGEGCLYPPLCTPSLPSL